MLLRQYQIILIDVCEQPAQYRYITKQVKNTGNTTQQEPKGQALQQWIKE